MAVAFRAASTAGNASGTNLTITKPTGTADNDILVVVLYREAGTWTPPAGWAQWGSDKHNFRTPTNDMILSVYWKRASSEGANYTFNLSTTTWRSACMAAFSGAITSGDPADLTIVSNADNSTSVTTAKSITTVTTNTMAIAFHGNYNGSDVTVSTSGYTKGGGVGGCEIWYKATAGTGATGDKAFGLSPTLSGADSATFHIAIKPPASGLSATLNQTTETDTAQALTKRKQKAIGQNTETDLAQALTRVKRLLIGQNSETDSPQAFTARKVLTIGQVSETDSAQAFTPLADIVGTANQVTETDTAQAFTARKVKEIAQVTETDSTQALTVRKEKAIAQISETDTAQSLSASKARVISQVEEIDTTQPILSIKQKSIGQVEEIDFAQPFTETGAIVAVIGQVVETDLAQQLFPSKRVSIAQVVEIDSVQSVRVVKIKAIGQVTEIDLAQALSLGQEVTGFLRELHLYPRTTKLTLSPRSTELTLYKRSLKLNLKEVDV